ncbi:MAG: LSM domain-containing protein, partial [Candidatus Methanomethyliaceae archaeon]
VKFDQTMNLVLTDAMETIDDGSPLAKYGKILVRGSNILYIVTSFSEGKTKSSKQ